MLIFCKFIFSHKIEAFIIYKIGSVISFVEKNDVKMVNLSFFCMPRGGGLYMKVEKGTHFLTSTMRKCNVIVISPWLIYFKRGISD